MNAFKCPSCDKITGGNEKFCSECGQQLNITYLIATIAGGLCSSINFVRPVWKENDFGKYKKIAAR